MYGSRSVSSLIIPIYAAEQRARLADQIRASASVRLTAQAIAATKPTGFRLDQLPVARAGLTDFDIYHFRSVLCTASAGLSGWNKNDDVFDAGETWQARSTPVNKQVNYVHSEKDIIGHIVGSSLFVDGEPVEDNGTVPESFDIVVASVLYRKWESPDLQRRMDGLLAGIAKGEWFVSMECLLRNFDYALRSEDGTTKILARNAATAFLTKHLRIFGGDGTYQGFRLGRLLRNFTFSGQGLVQQPANDRSIILPPEIVTAAEQPVSAGWLGALTANRVPSSEHREPESDLHRMVAERDAAFSKDDLQTIHATAKFFDGWLKRKRAS